MWQKIKDFFKGALIEIERFFNPVVQEVAANGGTRLLTAALNAVYAAERTGGKGEDKFRAATESVKNELREIGIDLAKDLLNAVVTNAVVKMNRELNKP